MEAMRVRLSARIGGALLGIVACGAVLVEEPEAVLGGDLNGTQNAPEARRVTLGGNLFVEPCNSCNYDSNKNGYAVVGPDNCLEPGTTQWLGVPFIAAATGVPKQIAVPLIVRDPRHCPAREVTLSIYTDACYPVGPGTPLVSAVATRLPRATCNLGLAKLTNAPTLTRGQKYWVVATTTADQSGLDANWKPSNNAQCAFNTGTGWTQSNGGTPAFLVQGIGTLKGEIAPEPSNQGFGGNLLIDPCTGCNFDPHGGGLDVRGPDNCTSLGLFWSAVPFVAAKSGVPTRISASIIVNLLCQQNNTVTLSIYTDNCGLGPGDPLVSGVATVPTSVDLCELAVAKLSGAPALQEGVKYWVVGSTDENQSQLDATWYGSNNAQFGADLGDGWLQYTAGTPGFLVQ
jgi:hypothetical protein